MPASVEYSLRKLIDISGMIASRIDSGKLIETIMDAVIELSGAERGFLILLDGNDRRVAAARNMDKEEIQRANAKISSTIVNAAGAARKPLIVGDAINEAPFNIAASVQSQKLRSVCVMPLADAENLIGFIYLDNRFQPAIFAEEGIEILKAFSAHASIYVAKARLFEENGRLRGALERRVESQGEEIRRNRELLVRQSGFDEIAGNSPAIVRLFKVLQKAADVSLPVLICGESGTGKELAARAIHCNGPRRDKPFISANCGAIPSGLMESELFGHVKGAFTGADKERKGLFEMAHTGTLFLDEIASTSKELQQGLLRVVQDGEFRKIGGKETIKVDVRIVAACNVDLLRLVEDGLFREDLYFRLNVIPVAVPPLRERLDDLPLLVERFLEAVAKETGAPRKRITPAAMQKLASHRWPGNVRELENLIRQAAVMGESASIDEQDIVLRQAERLGLPAGEIITVDEYIRKMYEEHSPKLDQKAIADKLGISRKSLWEKRKKWESS